MFSEYPVVTNESLKLKMETIGQIPINVDPDSSSSEQPQPSLDAKQ